MKYSEANFDELCTKEGIVNEGNCWSNDSPKANFDLFRCYWCLIGYTTWEESRSCNCDKSGIALQMVT